MCFMNHIRHARYRAISLVLKLSMSLCSLSHFLRVVYVVLWFSGCEGFLFPPREDEEVPVDPGSASYVNSSEFLAKWLEDPRNREIVAPITDYVTETIDPGLMTNSPDAYYVVSLSKRLGAVPIN